MESFVEALDVLYNNVVTGGMGTNVFEEVFISLCAALPIIVCVLLPLLALRMLIRFIG